MSGPFPPPARVDSPEAVVSWTLLAVVEVLLTLPDLSPEAAERLRVLRDGPTHRDRIKAAQDVVSLCRQRLGGD